MIGYQNRIVLVLFLLVAGNVCGSSFAEYRDNAYKSFDQYKIFFTNKISEIGIKTSQRCHQFKNMLHVDFKNKISDVASKLYPSPIVKSFGKAGIAVAALTGSVLYSRRYGYFLTEDELNLVQLVRIGSKKEDIIKVKNYFDMTMNLKNDYNFIQYLLDAAVHNKNEQMIYILLMQKYKNENAENLSVLAHELCNLGICKKVALHPEARRRRCWWSGWMLPDRCEYKL